MALARALQHAAPDLIPLHAHEQRAEVALAEALVAATLDDLEEYGADERAREDLQQIAPVCAIEQDAALLQLLHRLSVARQPLLQHVVVRIRRGRHEREPAGVKLIPGRED